MLDIIMDKLMRKKKAHQRCVFKKARSDLTPLIYNSRFYAIHLK